MIRPASTWIDELPSGQLIIELSVWSADLVRIADDLARIGSHTDMLHLDAADGHFAPALLFFPDLVAAIRRVSALPVHVHLMVADDILLSQIDQFAEAGCDLISIHLENEAVADIALDSLEARGVAAGMVLKLDTPVVRVARYLPRLRFVTLLGTAIGAKGQGLDARAAERLCEAKRMIRASGASRRILLAADGGIREHTVPLLRAAGADAVVLGSLAFGTRDLNARMAWLRGL
jgi:ribulose-phosphate 3-epimerase